MLAVSTKVDYGIKLLRQLARRTPQAHPIPLAAVAAKLHLPGAYLAHIARQLKHAGLLESFEGVRGGYRLARPLREITLGAIIAALEPRRRVVRCLQPNRRCCPPHSRCDLQQWWRKLEISFEERFNSLTLANLP